MSDQYKLYDYWDKDKENPINLTLNGRIHTGEEFEHDGQVYRVIEANNHRVKDAIDTALYLVSDFFLNIGLLRIALLLDSFRPSFVRSAILRTIRVKVLPTTTMFPHDCPAVRYDAKNLTKMEVVRLQEKLGEKRANKLLSGRLFVKSQEPVWTCPKCGVEYWREEFQKPEPVYVDKVMNEATT